MFVLEFLENFKSIPLHDLESFKKWLNFIRFIPREHPNLNKIQNMGVATISPEFDCQKVIDEHISKMLQFQNFKKSTLPECIDAFLKDRVTSKMECAITSAENPEASCVAKQDSISQRSKYFKMVYDQLFNFNRGPIKSPEENRDFYSLIDVLFNIKNKFLNQLHPQMVNAFSTELVNRFRA